jgi:hypothetical protein
VLMCTQAFHDVLKSMPWVANTWPVSFCLLVGYVSCMVGLALVYTYRGLAKY